MRGTHKGFSDRVTAVYRLKWYIERLYCFRNDDQWVPVPVNSSNVIVEIKMDTDWLYFLLNITHLRRVEGEERGDYLVT